MPVWLIVLAGAGWALLGLLLLAVGWDFCRSLKAALDSPPPVAPGEDLEEENASLRERVAELCGVAEAQTGIINGQHAEIGELKAKLLAAAERIAEQSECLSRRAEKPDAARGLYEKFRVTRLDGTDGPGGKHEGCRYFVLDLTHDPFAFPAIRAYARACEATLPVLAADLRGVAAAKHKEG